LRTRLKSYLKATTIVDVLPLREIIAPRVALREDMGDIAGLAASIKRRGVLEPIIVRPKDSKFEIIAGHRRYTACRMNGMSEIPAIILDMSDSSAFEVAVEENVHRKMLDPIEEAAAFRIYVDKHGYGSMSELAEKIGKSEEYVSHRIALLDLSPEIQESVRRRLLTSSNAWEISRIRDRDVQMELARIALEKVMTVRQVRTATNLVNEGVPMRDALERVERKGGLLEPESQAEMKRLKVKKAALTVLRAAMIRLDNMIGDLDETPDASRELIEMRRATHELVDRFVGSSDDKVECKKIATFVKQKFIENINTRDMSASFYVRTQQGYSLYDDFPPLSLMEYPQARDHMARVYRAIEKSDSRIRNLRIKILGEVALATFTFHYDMIVEGFTFLAKSRVTLVLVKASREWRVMHEHWSQANYNHASFNTISAFSKRYRHMKLDGAGAVDPAPL
jgi:ParB family transcriptional regulator, chromosome partitioning protein